MKSRQVLFIVVALLFVAVFRSTGEVPTRVYAGAFLNTSIMHTGDEAPKTTVNPAVGVSRNLIIWPPDKFVGSYEPGTAHFISVVDFLRRLKGKSFNKLVMKFDLNRIKAAIDAGWALSDMILNINCCYTCGHKSRWLDLFLSDIVPQERAKLQDDELAEVKVQLVKRAAESGYSDDHGAISAFFERWKNQQVDGEYDCHNPYPMSLEILLKEVKRYSYVRRYQQSAPPSEYEKSSTLQMTDKMYRMVDGFYAYYQDEPGIQQERRCRHLDKCNGADITAFKLYAQRLDFMYNPGKKMTPLTIGDGRFSRNRVTDGGDEGGLESWVNIGDGIAFTYYHGRVRLFGIQALALWPKDDQRSSWTEFAELIETKISSDQRLKSEMTMAELVYENTPEPSSLVIERPIVRSTSTLPVETPWEMRYMHSFPWFKYGEEDEFIDLFSHAINEGFHSMAYYALEYTDSREEFLAYIEEDITPLLKESGWVEKE